MTVHRVVVFGAGPHRERLRARLSGQPVELVHVDFTLPWEEIAARRAGVVTAAPPVAASLRAQLTEADVVFGFGLPARLTAMTPRLRWVETPATGYDQLFGTGVLETDIAVTTVGGLFAPWVAEHVFALLFALVRRAEHFAAAQGRAEWHPATVRGLHGAAMAVIGLGNIGQAVARAAKAFGMHVIGTRQRVADVPPGVDKVYPRAQLDALLAAADVVVVAVTGTADTIKMIGATQLAAMKADAYFINVARGIVVDEAALAAALARGHLAGAGLDVFVEEPLPTESPLWRDPKVVITPHVAASVGDKLARSIDHFADNVVRFCAGQVLRDQIPPRR